MKTLLFDFILPPELIATRPAEPRDQSRMLVAGEALQDKKINDLQQQINELKAMVETLSKQRGNTTAFSTTFLKQNVPNPVKNNTVISYFLPGHIYNRVKAS